MSSNDYRFTTHWRVPGTIEQVADIIGDAPSLVRWWPSVYLEVKQLSAGDKNGLGKVIDLYTKGWLPYTLRWQFRVTEVNYPHGFSLRAWGDFVGEGIWTFEQDGDWVNVIYVWKVQADKPLLKHLSFLMKPIFSANHRWAMEMGEKSLKLELARHRAQTAAELAQIPAPPGATTTSIVPLLLMLAGMVSVGVLLWQFLKK